MGEPPEEKAKVVLPADLNHALAGYEYMVHLALLVLDGHNFTKKYLRIPLDEQQKTAISYLMDELENYKATTLALNPGITWRYVMKHLRDVLSSYGERRAKAEAELAEKREQLN